MKKPKIVIAEKDFSYIVPLQERFVVEYFNAIELEIITDDIYYNEFFSKPQKIDVLVVSEELYSRELQRHEILNLFVLSEKEEGEALEGTNATSIFRYSSVKEIFNLIVGRSAECFRNVGQERKETSIVSVISACGGSGKTTIAMGLCASLANNYKRVLYVNASRLQCFRYLLKDRTPISDGNAYASLHNPSPQIYQEIRSTLRREIFSYLPAFRAPLMSMGIAPSVYWKFVQSAKESREYDYIVVDVESSFDQDTTKLLDISSQVIVVTEPGVRSIDSTNHLVSNLNISDMDKYLFVCNKYNRHPRDGEYVREFRKKYVIAENIEFSLDDNMNDCRTLQQLEGIKRLAFLLL